MEIDPAGTPHGSVVHSAGGLAPLELDDRVAIVTGSTRGIGAAVAHRLSEAGARVVVTGRDPAAVAEVARSMPGPALAVAMDVRDSVSVSTAVAEVIARWGAIDVLVNNAGVALDNFLTRTTDDRWNETLNVNLSGTLRAMRSVVPSMKRSGRGAIVNVTSWSGLRGNPGQAAYAASKAGQIGLTLTAAKELGQFGIRVNAVSPSVPTDMTRAVPRTNRAERLAERPIRREGTLAEVAEAILFLVSDRSAYTTGQILHVDGGLHLS